MLPPMAGRVPPEVFAALADRAASLRGRATGRVLDLDTDPLDDADGVYDTIYAFLQAPQRQPFHALFAQQYGGLAKQGGVQVSVMVAARLRHGGCLSFEVTDVILTAST